MAARSSAWSLWKAILNGAVIGPIVIFLNLYSTGKLGTTAPADVAMMMVGGVFGGALLFLFIALLVRFLRRRSD